jgi:phage head maturation protease
MPGCFDAVIRARRCQLWADHIGPPPGYAPYADAATGTLRLFTTPRGLHIEADLPDTDEGRRLAALVRSGTIAHLSLGRGVGPECIWSQSQEAGELQRKSLYHMAFVEISLCFQYGPKFTSTYVRVLEEPQADRSRESVWPGPGSAMTPDGC